MFGYNVHYATRYQIRTFIEAVLELKYVD